MLRSRLATAAPLLLLPPLLVAGPAFGQIPDAKKLAQSLTGGASKKDGGAPAKAVENPASNVVEGAGPIRVRDTVNDASVEAKLNKWLPRYPGVISIHADVENGVATLTGHVVDEDVSEHLLEFTRRVEGVHLVINQTETDAQVLTASERASKKLHEFFTLIKKTWLVGLIALGILAGSVVLARLFNAYSETLLAPFSGNALLRSVLGSILGGAIILLGLFAALSVLQLTQVVLSVLGLAGVVALAVGFAFRDITENFIASVLLGVRRPFRIGDYVQVAGQAGVVRSLNTRATVLVTLEGKQIRIPNATIFKEILVNSSASDSSRSTFDVVIPYDVSTTEAQEAIGRVLGQHEGILDKPPARALVDGLEPNGVRLRVYFWSPTKGIDGDKLLSDAKLAVKVALQEAGIAPPPSVLAFAGRVPIVVSRSEDGAKRNGGPEANSVSRLSCALPESQARANLKQDTRAVRDAAARPETGSHIVQHVLSDSKDRVSDEGVNLLQEAGKS